MIKITKIENVRSLVEENNRRRRRRRFIINGRQIYEKRL